MGNQADHLNSLLVGELSAVKTYEMALDNAVKSPEAVSTLENCKMCHAKRASKLTEMISSIGGKPAEGSGAWGAFAKTVEAGATALGEKAAIGSIKEGEDHGMELYRSEIKNLEGNVLNFVESELFPAQERTRDAIAGLAA